MQKETGHTPAGTGAFWERADKLVATHPIVIDRPQGSAHPRRPELIYPLDYGYLEGTGAVDGGGVHVWRGSLPDLQVTGVIVTVDVWKGDAEVKLLVGCTPAEGQIAHAHQNQGSQGGMLVLRAGADPLPAS